MTNKIALITGASKGIGLEVARQLGRQGITVLVAARTKTAADEAAAGLLQDGIQAVGVKLEVTNSAHIAELAQFIEKTYGRLDILVNNAGILAEKAGYEGDAFRDTFEVNTFAPYLITEALLPLLLKSKAGRIVNQSSAIGSIQFQLTNERVQRLATPAYAASKAALNMLTAYWAQKKWRDASEGQFRTPRLSQNANGWGKGGAVGGGWGKNGGPTGDPARGWSNRRILLHG